MKYTSTRNSAIAVTASEAIVKGISEEGGLFVPTELPKLTHEDIQRLADKPYAVQAVELLEGFLDLPAEELRGCVNNAYDRSIDQTRFGTTGITRLVEMEQRVYMLELWHGPTAAFKDMALQLLPGLLNSSLNMTNVLAKPRKKTLILVATSGDTGKAALEGFKDVDGVEIAVFYPQDGVSLTQKLHMATQEGDNVHVFAVKGNFDDCQNAVKAMFADEELSVKTSKSGVYLSSANSINWGRLCPQIVYYVAAYADLVRRKAIRCGDKVNICVPTGNFGNILAAYYAKEMGIPVNRLICASNTNKVLTDFINTGVYDRNRDFHATVSPSMDILISSNLERLLYHIAGNNDALVNEWFTSLAETGKFKVNEEIKAELKAMFYGGWCSERDTARTIKDVFNKQGYLMDTHTAVAYKVLRDFLKANAADKTKTIIASTASPYKFAPAVYEALYGKYKPEESESEPVLPDFAELLEQRTEIGIPKPLVGIGEKSIRFETVLEPSQIKGEVLKLL